MPCAPSVTRLAGAVTAAYSPVSPVLGVTRRKLGIGVGCVLSLPASFLPVQRSSIKPSAVFRHTGALQEGGGESAQPSAEVSSRGGESQEFWSVQCSCILYTQLLDQSCQIRTLQGLFTCLPSTSFFCHLTPPVYLLHKLAAKIAGRGWVSKPCKVLICQCNCTNNPEAL